MEKRKLTLEDLKLESFLTELDDAKILKVQGGYGDYGDSEKCGSDAKDCGPAHDYDNSKKCYGPSDKTKCTDCLNTLDDCTIGQGC